MWQQRVMKLCHVLRACFSNDRLYQSLHVTSLDIRNQPGSWSSSCKVLIFFKQIGQEITITDEKPNLNNNLHLAGVDRWHSTENFALHFLFLSYTVSISGNLSIITLHSWLIHTLKHLCIYSSKFLLLRISFTTTCVPKIPVQHIIWG